MADTSQCHIRTSRNNMLGHNRPRVQLAPFDDTPNPGGEYKAWLTPIDDYGQACPPGHASFGFCDKDSKTDNFKVKKPGVAFVTVCKFNDLNNSGTQDQDEPLIP